MSELIGLSPARWADRPAIPAREPSLHPLWPVLAAPHKDGPDHSKAGPSRSRFAPRTARRNAARRRVCGATAAPGQSPTRQSRAGWCDRRCGSGEPGYRKPGRPRPGRSADFPPATGRQGTLAKVVGHETTGKRSRPSMRWDLLVSTFITMPLEWQNSRSPRCV